METATPRITLEIEVKSLNDTFGGTHFLINGNSHF